MVNKPPTHKNGAIKGMVNMALGLPHTKSTEFQYFEWNTRELSQKLSQKHHSFQSSEVSRMKGFQKSYSKPLKNHKSFSQPQKNISANHKKNQKKRK